MQVGRVYYAAISYTASFGAPPNSPIMPLGECKTKRRYNSVPIGDNARLQDVGSWS